MSNADPRASSGGATYRMLRELGARTQHSYAAIREPHELVVAQRFVRMAPLPAADLASASAERHATELDAASVALLLRDARCLAKNWHANIARVRHVDLAGGELTIATELLDGATLADLFVEGSSERTSARDPRLPLPVLVRILLDVLGGLNALHGLRDGMNLPLGAIHGELCPANIVVGKDGVARIIDVLRPRPVRLAHPSSAAGYAAPETLDPGGSVDPRSDVYAVGVILWEALAARRLFDEIEPARVLSRQREGEIVLPAIHPSSPFARLAEVAMRALAFDPALRFRGASEMAGELRRVAGTRLASGGVVAARVADLAGDRIRMRRALLEPAVSGTLRRVSEGSIAAAQEAVRLREEAREVVPEEPTPRSGPLSSGPRSSGPSLSPPVPRRSSMVRASPRVLAPTLSTEMPDTLLAASRPSRPPAADDFDVDEAEEELAGPRGSSPELDLESALAAAIKASETRNAQRADLESLAAPTPTISPITPNLPFARKPESAFARRATVPTANETPGELVVPVTPEPSGSPSARSRGRVALGLMAAVAVLAGGASVAMRIRANRAEPAVTATGLTEPPPAITELPLPSLEIAPPPTEPPSAAAAAGTSATPPISAPPPPPRAIVMPRAAERAPAPAPANAPTASAKPQKSVYDPD